MEERTGSVVHLAGIAEVWVILASRVMFTVELLSVLGLYSPMDCSLQGSTLSVGFSGKNPGVTYDVSLLRLQPALDMSV